MNTSDIILTAISAILANKLRSILTVLGIIIGVAAVISVMSIGEGARAEITAKIEGLGTNLIFVRPGAAVENGVKSEQGTAPTLTIEDAAALTDKTKAPDVLLVAPEIVGKVARLTLSAGVENVTTSGRGVTPEYPFVRNLVIGEGRFISERDVENADLVIVLGSSVAKDLFKIVNPIGQMVRGFDNRFNFTVIGVLQESGGTGFGVSDDFVFLPISTVQYRLQAGRTVKGEYNVSSINVQAIDSDSIASAKEQVTAILRQRHQVGEDSEDFTITSQVDLQEAFGEVAAVFTIFLGSIAGISLLVGGIGIMNIMLVTVTERTREIGIRKAVGAKRGDILRQFLAEAMVLSFSGGLFGIGAGWVLARGFARISINDQTIQTLILPSSVAIAVGVAVTIGLFFGLYPAFLASRLDPIEALRRE
jgi:putative ABC transport system permease protein